MNNEKKALQIADNHAVENFLNHHSEYGVFTGRVTRLRYCKAAVLEYYDKETGEVYHLLRSYNTIVAAVVGHTGYDFLRLVYGYTATSAQHIAKFFGDYGVGVYGYGVIRRYYHM